MTSDTASGSVRPALAARSDSISRDELGQVRAGLALDDACARRVPQARPLLAGQSCSASRVRAPIPRGGKLATRRNAPSSPGAASSRRYASACLTSARSKNRMPPYTRYGTRGVEQRVLEYPRLRVRPIEHGDLGQREALGRESSCDVDDERRFVGVGRSREAAHRLSLRPRSSRGSSRAAPGCCWISALARSRMCPCER